MLQLDNDFASRGFNAKGPTNTSMGIFNTKPIGHALEPNKKRWKDIPDRFLRGGNED